MLADWRHAQSIPLYPGMHACECMWKYRSISYRCLLLVEGFIKVTNGLLMTLKEDEIFKCLAAHSQYSLRFEALNVIVELSKSLPIEVHVNTSNSTIKLHLSVNSQNCLPIKALNLIDQTLFHGDHFVFSVPAAIFLGKNASIRSKLPTAVC